MSANTKKRNRDKFNSVNTIKHICLSETDKLADEISWSSSESSRILNNCKSSAITRPKNSKLDKKQIFSSEEKVKKWLSKTVFNVDKKNPKRKSLKNSLIDYNAENNQKEVQRIETCPSDSESNDTCPVSPVLVTSGNRSLPNVKNTHQTPLKYNDMDCEDDTATSPILEVRKTKDLSVKFKRKEENRQVTDSKEKSYKINTEEDSPILNTFVKKRKLNIKKDNQEEIHVKKYNNKKSTNKSVSNVKKILFPYDLDASQSLSNNISNPATPEVDVIISQQSDKSAIIDILTDTPKCLSDASCRIASFVSSSTKTTSIEDMPQKKFIYDKTNCADSFESPVKRKKKLPSNSIAGRLQKLIKKHKSSLSLWRHEHYLAANSNFQRPASKDGCMIFKIVKLEEDHGRLIVRCKLPDRVDLYTLVVNRNFVKKLTLSVDSDIKIYKPFTIFQVTRQDTNTVENVLVNVCRIEELPDVTSVSPILN